MKSAADLIPWKVTDISLRPYAHFWSMNPSIHFDGNLWRCSLRCADYCMLGGKTIRSPKAKSGETRTKNAMVIFNPASWKPVEIYKMHEHDELPRASCSSVGYEDLRLFKTDKGGLQAIAAALHLRRDDRHKQLVEQVLLTFDAQYDIVNAQPIRGAWSSTPQKNWAPFDHCVDPRFIYSIGKGTMLDDRDMLRDGEALVRPSSRSRGQSHAPDDGARTRAKERAQESEQERSQDRDRDKHRREWKVHVDEPSRGTYAGLRGGTQLVRVGDDTWLGIGHSMRFVDGLKYYYHVWYLADSRGKMKSASPPMKLAPNNGIEFAAGIAIDGDRVVVSFGVDDMECKIGETKLAAAMSMLQKVER